MNRGAPEAPQPSPSRWLTPLQILAILLLFDAALLPAFRARTLVSPVSALMDPASPNFVAAAFLALVGGLFAFRVNLVRRTGVTAGIAALLVVFSLVLLRSALSSHAFDGQPALHALFGEGFAVVAVVTLAVCTWPTALLWRHVAPYSLGARVTATAGALMVIFVYVGLQVLGSLDGAPLRLVVEASGGAAFLGDRVAAWLAFLPLVVACASLLVWLPGRIHGFAGPLAVAGWISALLPLLVLAFFVASANQWQEVLLPVQVSSLLAAGTLLLITSLGHLLAFVESSDA